MKRMLTTGALVCVLVGSLFAATALSTPPSTPPMTDCHSSFNWETQCCVDSSAEAGRWAYCRCMQAGGQDGECVIEANRAHNEALNQCHDAEEGCPPAFYWF